MIALRISPELVRSIDALAKRDRTTRSKEIIWLLRYALSGTPIEGMTAPPVRIFETVARGTMRKSAVAKSKRAAKPVPKPKKQAVHKAAAHAPAAKALKGALPKIGEKCPHGYMNWLLCPKCRP